MYKVKLIFLLLFYFILFYFWEIVNIAKNYQLFKKKVQVGKDQKKAQSEKDSHSKNRGGKIPN